MQLSHKNKFMSDRGPEDSKSLANLVQDLMSSDGPRTQTLYQRLVRQTSGLGYKLALSKLQDRERAEDALQDAYLIVFQKLNQLREASAFKAWFCRIVLHCCTKHYRKELPLESLESIEEKQTCPADKVSLEQLLRWLSKDDRNVLILRELVDLSYEEMAIVLDVPVGTVRSRLSAARKRASQLIKEHRYER